MARQALARSGRLRLQAQAVTTVTGGWHHHHRDDHVTTTDLLLTYSM